MPNAEPTSTTSEKVEGQQTEPTQPDALAELQAKYDALLETSRKWEGRSKANAEKAKQYDALAKQHPAVKVFVAGDFCALLGLVWRTII